MTTEQWRELVDALEPMLIGKPLSRQAIDALAKAVAAIPLNDLLTR
jgi:hypothetical protein